MWVLLRSQDGSLTSYAAKWSSEESFVALTPGRLGVSVFHLNEINIAVNWMGRVAV